MIEKMKTEQGVMKVKDVVPNPTNPRIIKGEQLTKLKKSIMEFPDMLSLRPLVIDEDNVVIGGNMRLKALTELNIKDVPYIKVFNLDEEKRKEFVIKDNASFGEWDWDVLVGEWVVDDLSDWGITVPKSYFDDDVEPQFDPNMMKDKLEGYINAKVKQIVLYFDSQKYGEIIPKLEFICEKEDLATNTDVFIFLLEEYYGRL